MTELASEQKVSNVMEKDRRRIKMKEEKPVEYTASASYSFSVEQAGFQSRKEIFRTLGYFSVYSLWNLDRTPVLISGVDFEFASYLYFFFCIIWGFNYLVKCALIINQI